MDKLTDYIFPLVLSSIAAIGAFIMRNIFGRIEKLEEKIHNTVTEQQVRQIVSDKIDPVKEDVQEIKQAIIKIYELYLSEKK